MDLANFTSFLFWWIFGPDIKWVITGKANICMAKNKLREPKSRCCRRILAWPVSVVRTVWIYLQLCPGPSLIYLSVYANARMEMFGYSHPVKTLTTNTFMTRAVKCLTKLFIRFNVQSNKCVGWKHIFCHLPLFKTQDNCRICMLSFPRFQNISWPAPSWRPGTGDWLVLVRPGSRKQPQITASCNHLVLMSVI